MEVRGQAAKGSGVSVAGYLAVGVDDGLPVVGLMSQNDSLMEEP